MNGIEMSNKVHLYKFLGNSEKKDKKINAFRSVFGGGGGEKRKMSQKKRLLCFGDGDPVGCSNWLLAFWV